MFVGSQSLAFKNKESRLAFETLRFNFPDLFIVANINPNFTAEMASDAVEILGANALAIHVNSVQELVMGEGDRDFTKWKDNIANILKTVKVPVIVKEVGYGMHEPTLLLLQELGVKHIDISGMGGINFSLIELKRQKKKIHHFLILVFPLLMHYSLPVIIQALKCLQVAVLITLVRLLNH